MDSNVIETAGLRRTFGKKGEIEAVAGVDLTVGAGSIFGFLGPERGRARPRRSGSSRRSSRPPAARRAVMGHDVATEPEQVRRRIGYVAQSGGSDPRMTRPGRARDAGPAVRPRRAPTAQARPRSCSTRWTSPRPATARSTPTPAACAAGSTSRSGMVHRPGLLFLDEPTTGLDPQARARMWDEVRALREPARRVFLTTHYLDEADALCDRLAIIDHGRIVAEGTSDELKRAVAGDVVTIGVDGSAELVARLAGAAAVRARGGRTPTASSACTSTTARRACPLVLRLLDGAGLAPQTLALHRPSLDDVFLRQTGRSLRDEAA